MVTGLAQETGRPEPTAVAMPREAADPAAASALPAPALLNLPEGMPAGRIDHGCDPGLLRPRAAPPGLLHPVAVGFAVLLVGWLVLSAVGFVGDQFARAPALGWATVVVFGAGLLAVLWGLWREARSSPAITCSIG